MDIGGSAYPINTNGRLKSFKCEEYLILDNCAEEEYEDKFVKPDIICDINKQPFVYNNIDPDFSYEPDLEIINPKVIKKYKKEIYERDKKVGDIYEKDGKLFRLIFGKKEFLKDIGKQDCVNYLGYNFNIVFVLEVFEYIFDPLTALRNIGWFMKEKGLLYITFTTSYCYHSPAEIDSLRYYKPAIKKLLKETGFKILEIIPRKMTKGREAYAEFIRQEGLHPVKNTDDLFDLGYIIKAQKL